MIVDLLKCGRCGLRWVNDDGSSRCPRCQRQSPAPTEVTVAGRKVRVGAVRLFGESAMAEPRGLAVLNLGTRCEHGSIHPYICREC